VFEQLIKRLKKGLIFMLGAGAALRLSASWRRTILHGWLKATCGFAEFHPAFDVVALESPISAYTKCRNAVGLEKPVDGVPINPQKLGNLRKREDLACGFHSSMVDS
jgi:hypothetical protein